MIAGQSASKEEVKNIVKLLVVGNRIRIIANTSNKRKPFPVEDSPAILSPRY